MGAGSERHQQHQPLGHARRRRRVRASRRRTAGQAIAAAQAQSAWGLSTPQQRFDILDDGGAEILARRAELGDLLAREEGKTLPEAIGEVVRAGNIFKFFAGEALRLPAAKPCLPCAPASAWKSPASRWAWWG